MSKGKKRREVSWPRDVQELFGILRDERRCRIGVVGVWDWIGTSWLDGRLHLIRLDSLRGGRGQKNVDWDWTARRWGGNKTASASHSQFPAAYEPVSLSVPGRPGHFPRAVAQGATVSSRRSLSPRAIQWNVIPLLQSRGFLSFSRVTWPSIFAVLMCLFAQPQLLLQYLPSPPPSTLVP